nr:MAG TPA: hypothetical protein [Caudoviricetes sp.]
MPKSCAKKKEPQPFGRGSLAAGEGFEHSQKLI